MPGPVCEKCGQISNRKERRLVGGVCPFCAEAEGTRKDTLQDLYNSFAGRGKRGFVAWLKKGKFLKPVENDGDLYRYNDRCEVIEALTGPEKYDKLLSEIADVILRVSKEALEA